jgi:hypothetical protein
MRGAAMTEFVICDQSIDTNHGYGKTPVENSETAKKRAALEKRLSNVQRWADAARKRSHNASKLYTKRCKLTKEWVTALYRVLNDHQIELEQQGTESWLLRKTIKEEKPWPMPRLSNTNDGNGKPTRPVTASMRSASAIVVSNVTRLARTRGPHDE